MHTLIHFIEKLTATVGKLASWLSLLLVVIIVADVLLRYVFHFSSPATFELEWHIFGVLFLFSAAWGLQQDRHVRVDVFYQGFSDKKKAVVDMIGTLLLLLPLCYVGLSESLSFVFQSFRIGETSPDPGGLPARYIIKAAIPIGFLLLGLQGIAIVFKSIIKLRA